MMNLQHTQLIYGGRHLEFSPDAPDPEACPSSLLHGYLGHFVSGRGRPRFAPQQLLPRESRGASFRKVESLLQGQSIGCLGAVGGASNPFRAASWCCCWWLHWGFRKLQPAAPSKQIASGLTRCDKPGRTPEHLNR